MRLTGYRRPNGRVGVRNHVVVLPVDDLSNKAAEGVAALIPGVVALTHPYGRLQFGEDLELTFRTLAGHGANPNVYGAVVIGIEPKWAERVASEIALTGKPVEAFAIEGQGDLRTIERASRVAYRLLQEASEQEREPVEIRELVLSIKCGESDPTLGLAGNPALGKVVDYLVGEGATVIFGETSELTGAEHLIAARCATPEVREAFLTTYRSYVQMIESKGWTFWDPSPRRATSAGVSPPLRKRLWGISRRRARVQSRRCFGLQKLWALERVWFSWTLPALRPK